MTSLQNCFEKLYSFENIIKNKTFSRKIDSLGFDLKLENFNEIDTKTHLKIWIKNLFHCNRCYYRDK